MPVGVSCSQSCKIWEMLTIKKPREGSERELKYESSTPPLPKKGGHLNKFMNIHLFATLMYQHCKNY